MSHVEKILDRNMGNLYSAQVNSQKVLVEGIPDSFLEGGNLMDSNYSVEVFGASGNSGAQRAMHKEEHKEGHKVLGRVMVRALRVGLVSLLVASSLTAGAVNRGYINFPALAADHMDVALTGDHMDMMPADHMDVAVAGDHMDRALAGDHMDVALAGDHMDRALAGDHMYV